MQNKSPVFLSVIDINLFVKGYEIPTFRHFDTSTLRLLVYSSTRLLVYSFTRLLVYLSTKNIICVKLFRIMFTSRKKVLSL